MAETGASPLPDIRKRLGRALAWVVPPMVVLAVIRTAAWWSEQSERAMRRGRRWPPDSVLVFLGH